MDKEGYPEESELELIRNWPFADSYGLVNYVVSIWYWGEAQIERKWQRDRFTKDYEFIITFHTGGWSGNEELIQAMNNNAMFRFNYHSWVAGGHHTYKIQPRRHGYTLVSEYCKNAKISRQYVSKAKDKFDWIEISKGKKLVRRKN